MTFEPKNVPGRGAVRIPTVRTRMPQPDEYARATCFEAGHLMGDNAGWRLLRPVIDADACTGCLTCYMDCPDGAIYKTHAEDGVAVAVDLGFCKGCGICAKECKFDAIAMESEREAVEHER